MADEKSTDITATIVSFVLLFMVVLSLVFSAVFLCRAYKVRSKRRTLIASRQKSSLKPEGPLTAEPGGKGGTMKNPKLGSQAEKQIHLEKRAELEMVTPKGQKVPGKEQFKKQGKADPGSGATALSSEEMRPLPRRASREVLDSVKRTREMQKKIRKTITRTIEPEKVEEKRASVEQVDTEPIEDGDCAPVPLLESHPEPRSLKIVSHRRPVPEIENHTKINWQDILTEKKVAKVEGKPQDVSGAQCDNIRDTDTFAIHNSKSDTYIRL